MSEVTLKEIVKALQLEVIWGTDFLTRTVKKEMLSRPSIEMFGGYFDYFEEDRIQVIGTKELAVYNMLDSALKEERLAKLFSYGSPAYIFTKNVKVPKEIVEAAIKYNMPLFKSGLSTSALIGNLTFYLSSKLARRKNVEGSLLEIYGVGVLIQGRPGIGKSETALELVRRGHILIADDITKVYQREPGMLIGETSKVTEKLMEIKDIGVVNILNLYGVKSFRHKKRIQMVVELIDVDSEIKHDDTITFFDTALPKITIVVASNRNIPSLVETAALNNRLKKMGQVADEELAERLTNVVVDE